jgi:CubicO group peptidase (beta-lactamase class C family)
MNNSTAVFDDKSIHLLDNLLNNDYHENEPGAAILVVINDEIVYRRCFGLANLDKNEKITPETNFRLASLTKQFTAYGIIFLEQQGKLSRNDTIGHFFSEKFQTKCPSISNKITIQHLLDHSSGLFDYEDHDLIDHNQWSDYDVLEIINDKTLFEPGTQYRYSNTGYVLLGLIIEIVSAKSLGDFFSENIFQPFNMKTSILYNSDQTFIQNRALGYIKQLNQENYELSDQSLTSATRGDGGIYMSLNDYLQWYYHYHPFLSTSAFPIDKKTSSSIYYYNLGWFLSDSSGQIRLHTGHSCGFTHQVFQIDNKQRKILVLYLTNSGNNDEKIQKFNRLLIENIPQLNPNNTNLLWEVEKLTR